MRAVSVVIGTYNRLSHLKQTIGTVRQELEGIEHEVLIIDGGSTDGTIRWLAEQKDLITIVQHNRGEWRGEPIERKSWGYFMNLGFRAATGTYVCMLSDDCLVIPGAIKKGVEQLEKAAQRKKRVGAAAFYWRNWPEQKRYWVGVTFGDHLFVNHGLYLREALERVGYIDEEAYHFYHADGDLSLRMWEAGYETVEAENSFIEHYSHANEEVREGNLERQQADWRTYETRWGKLGKPEVDWRERDYHDPDETAREHWGKRSRRGWLGVKR